MENITATTSKRVASLSVPFTYQVSLALRETGGGGATISQVTVTLSDSSGARTESQFSAAEVFGTTRIKANGTLMSTGITVDAPLASGSDITARVTFVDDRGNTGSAQASTALNPLFTGEWSGFTTITQPPGDWSHIRLSLVQNGDRLTGQLITRDNRQFSASGCVACEWTPMLSIRGDLPTGSSGCAIGMRLENFHFRGGQMQRLSVLLTGRCPGTASGTGNLERGM